MNTIRLAISTCPNDTYAFHALMNRLVDWRGLNFEFQLLDIQQLNDGLFANRFDVAKASFHAAALLADQTVVLPSGSAIGFGVGPLLLAAKPDTAPDSLAASMTLCPGTHTTATMLFRIFYPNAIESGAAKIEQVLFSEIMPRLQQGRADFGVCIHEGRFTWQENGLYRVEDLGTRWETEMKSPLPLGGVLASRNLADETTAQVQQCIQDSIQYANAHPESTLPTMRQHAAEFDDDVLMKHVELYVNEWTVDLGEVGRSALSFLAAAAKRAKLVSEDAGDIEVFG